MLKMELPVFFLLILSINGMSVNHNTLSSQNLKCGDMEIKKINNNYYVRDLIKEISGIPADMSIHWKTGRIFFTLVSDEMKMKLQVLNPNGQIDTLKVPGTGQSTAVDNRNDIVYLATDNGVYMYSDDGIKPYTASGEDVMYVTVSSDGGTMFIATWPQNRVHMITKNGQKQETFSLIPDGHALTVDSKNNIYFVATRTPYVLRAGFTIPIKIKGLPSDNMTGIFSRGDKVYAMDERGNMYLIDSENAMASFFGAFDVTGVNTFGLDAFDNVYIGVKGSIFKYNKMDTSPCSEYVENVS